MKRIMYGIGYGFLFPSMLIWTNQLFSPHVENPIFSLEPKLGILFFAIVFSIGFVIGIFEYGRKQRKREEEEEQQAEQEETNRLMREYLEKKLREENKDN